MKWDLTKIYKTKEDYQNDLKYVKESISSYKQLPITLYQIQNKYRDEIRARFGLQRAKGT